MIVEPNVKLLAHTVINDDEIAELMDIQPQSTDADAELQQVMGMARGVLEPLAPSIFGRGSN